MRLQVRSRMTLINLVNAHARSGGKRPPGLTRAAHARRRLISWRLVPAPLTANASTPPHTSTDSSTGLSDGGSGHADTTNSCPTRPAAEPDLRGHAVWVKRRYRHCL